MKDQRPADRSYQQNLLTKTTELKIEARAEIFSFIITRVFRTLGTTFFADLRIHVQDKNNKQD